MDSQETFVGASMVTRLVIDKISGPKNALLEFVDLNNTPLRVGGPLVNFILFLKWMHP